MNSNRVIVLNIRILRIILKALKKGAADDPEEKELYDEAICVLKSQFTKLKGIEPFMRTVDWIRDEIKYEKSGKQEQDCQNDIYVNGSYVPCPNKCRAKLCVECWEELLKYVHGAPGHQCIKHGEDTPYIKK